MEDKKSEVPSTCHVACGAVRVGTMRVPFMRHNSGKKVFRSALGFAM